MRANSILFWILAVFFALSAAGYTFWAWIYYDGKIEWVGTVALILSAILGVFLAFFLGRTAKGFGGVLPEDRLDANIDDGDPEIGHFSPWSWWPFFLGGAVGIMALGLAVGVWIAFIGVPILLVALVGWVYEYYRGYFAR
ncbi:cytochrome c oxidase subunit 4 [Gryllotalpicola ginsengisoli]|uniref:cytochrome c oxidase subunit 4 n=1 Tax=Gryllotalpicola ginsengisoli TaxID=444608 RepID=UPI0003B482F9|nr:cytochrome c oxidase subunit 4 [Gryllotalpicola ginsengisoli]